MLVALLGMGIAGAAISITVDYTGDPTYQPVFTKAANFWMGQLTGYREGSGPGTIVISASMEAIDGKGGYGGSSWITGGVYSGSYAMVSAGSMEFDTADFTLENATSVLFEKVIFHEMAHVLGLGLAWDWNFLYDATVLPVTDPKTGEQVGRFLGKSALAAWRSEFGSPTDTYVPVEKSGVAGFADVHWNELNAPNAATGTGYVSRINGLDLSKELMTATLDNSGPNGFSDVYVSSVTLGSFRDMGYTIIPETGSVMALALAAALSLARRRR